MQLLLLGHRQSDEGKHLFAGLAAAVGHDRFVQETGAGQRQLLVEQIVVLRQRHQQGHAFEGNAVGVQVGVPGKS